ncbi:unnamed protein product, partial [Iphiclides podalirius]
MDRIVFSVNGKQCSVGPDIDSDLSLNDYLRNYLNLRGTKYMCKEGGCGACVVAVTTVDHFGRKRTLCYHPVQRALAEYNGSQCGYCSPGWVMSMYSLLESSNHNFTSYEIEKSFASNTCRCTGYRTILDAFKSFAKIETKFNINDIEDLNICNSQKSCDTKCDNTWCIVGKNDLKFDVKKIIMKDGHVWYKANNVQDVFDVLKTEGTKSYQLINGNTGRGAFPIVIGTIGGNLMLKHKHPSFPSDIFLLFETVRATLTIRDANGSMDMSLPNFLSTDMTGKLLAEIKLPPLSSNNYFISFKVMPRSQNAPAHVNAAFIYQLHRADRETLQSVSIVVGGLSEKFVRAHNTEKFLLGKKLFTNETLQGALRVLDKEMPMEEIRANSKAQYRKKCVLGLFYKGLLSLIPPEKVNTRYRSGANDFKKTRPVSKGSEIYDTNPLLWPLNEPMPKLESLVQCSGEALYVNDVPAQANEVFCSFVTSNVCRGVIKSIDPTAALELPGVLSFFTAKNIPGKNSFLPKKVPGILVSEEVLCERDVKYYDQPIGIIVADTEKLANHAARLVKAKYEQVKSLPVLTIADAKSREPERVSLLLFYPARGRGLDIKTVIKGKQCSSGQYHYHMETQSCVTRCSEDGIDVYAASQWPNQIHVAISEMLKLPQNRINIAIPRCGGSFGAKITRSGMVACACALVTHLTTRPSRFVMSMEANMRIVGKRLPYLLEYEVGVDKAGEIQYMEYNLYEDHGYVVSDTVTIFSTAAIKNCYNNKRWQYKLFTVTTDTASNTYARSPGALETIAMTEHVMERISYELDLDPVEVRLKNVNPLLTDVSEIVRNLLEDSDYKKRREEMKNFNEKNRWKKRGLRVAIMSWPAGTIMDYHILITVYHGDATVVVKHGGIEVGQGINTKVAQAVAYTLSVSLDKVRVKPYEVSSNPNCSTSGSSRTTHAICFGAIKCCQLLLDRLSVVRDTLSNPTWELLIQAAFTAGINLQASYRVTPNDEEVHRSAGAAVAEVELDILTGEHEVLRVDIIEDVGLSLNPEIDVGQIEGAFVMGLGYWTCEQLLYDETTGELLTNRSWNYHVPLAKDIPLDFRVKLRRNSLNPIGTLGARAVSEPPICLAVSVAFALREAIAASRVDSGYPRNQWFDVDGPYTLETNLLKSDARQDEFLFY